MFQLFVKTVFLSLIQIISLRKFCFSILLFVWEHVPQNTNISDIQRFRILMLASLLVIFCSNAKVPKSLYRYLNEGVFKPHKLINQDQVNLVAISLHQNSMKYMTKIGQRYWINSGTSFRVYSVAAKLSKFYLIKLN